MFTEICGFSASFRTKMEISLRQPLDFLVEFRHGRTPESPSQGRRESVVRSFSCDGASVSGPVGWGLICTFPCKDGKIYCHHLLQTAVLISDPLHRILAAINIGERYGLETFFEQTPGSTCITWVYACPLI